MATLDKRIQVLMPEKMVRHLTILAQEQEQSVGHLIREAVVQLYFADEAERELTKRRQMVEEMIAFNLPVGDWQSIEAEIETMWESTIDVLDEEI
ncbi:MAG: hypothetical protein DWI57_17790 [Chloroflexi bacterium]|nr:MAG: hypothetical protein DWI57_17790 [Chloroflexota bacterium]